VLGEGAPGRKKALPGPFLQQDVPEGALYVVEVSIETSRMHTPRTGETVSTRRTDVPAAREAIPEGSRGGPFSRRALGRAGVAGGAALVAVIASAVLLVLTEFSTLISVDVGTGPPCEDVVAASQRDGCKTTGAEQHSYALLLLAALLVIIAWPAAIIRSRVGATALLVVGVVVLAIALLGDLPDTAVEGAIGNFYTEAKTSRGPAITYEIAAGALAVLGGLLGLRRRRPSAD